MFQQMGLNIFSSPIGPESLVCIFCGKGAQDFEKLSQLKAKGEEVASHSREAVASTENLFMPMIQFAFLFPTIVVLLFSQSIIPTNLDPISNSTENFNQTMEEDISNIKYS